MFPLIQIFNDLWLSPDSVKSICLIYPLAYNEKGQLVPKPRLVVKTDDETFQHDGFDNEAEALEAASIIVERLNCYRE